MHEMALARLRALAEDRRAEAGDGGRTDVDTVWPSEILAILDEPDDASKHVGRATLRIEVDGQEFALDVTGDFRFDVSMPSYVASCTEAVCDCEAIHRRPGDTAIVSFEATVERGRMPLWHEVEHREPIDLLRLNVPDWDHSYHADQQARTTITTLIGVVSALTALLRAKGAV